MRKFYKILNTLIPFLFLLVFLPKIVIADTVKLDHKCTSPKAYNLSEDEINASNNEFYCWEIRYFRDYKNVLTMNKESYYALFPKNLSSSDIETLRKFGITPEKADYLYKYYIHPNSNKSTKYENLIRGAIAKASENIGVKSQYKYGRPIYFFAPFTQFYDFTKTSIFSQFKGKSFYYQFLKIFGNDCLRLTSPIGSIDSVFNVYPLALKPSGVMGRYIVNPFAEVVGYIGDKKSNFLTSTSPIYVLGNSKAFATWDNRSCTIHNLSDEIHGSFSCISCTIFEVAFNTVSRIGFVLFDKLSRYAIALMVGLFSILTLFMFYDNVIKKQDGKEFIKTFFTKSVGIVIIGALLNVSITDENNIINYVVRPITSFMSDYNKMMNSVIDKSDKPFSCSYATKDIASDKVIFSSDVKKNIVCTIERISEFNNLNITIGKYQFIQGFHQLINIDVSYGFIKMILGLIIMGLFFFYNLSIPLFFIESLFKIALVIFLFPLFMVGYALDKKKFVRQGLDTFLSAVFQIISLSIMCSVVSLLLMYISNIDFTTLQSAIENNNSQEMTSQIFKILSYNTNGLLQIIYTGILCWYLMGQALTIATKFSGYNTTETLPEKFKGFATNIIHVVTSVVFEKIGFKKETSAMANKLKSFIDHDIKEKQKEIDDVVDRVGLKSNIVADEDSASTTKTDSKTKNKFRAASTSKTK